MAQKKMMGFPVGLETKSDGNTSPKECPETIRVCVDPIFKQYSSILVVEVEIYRQVDRKSVV